MEGYHGLDFAELGGRREAAGLFGDFDYGGGGEGAAVRGGGRGRVGGEEVGEGADVFKAVFVDPREGENQHH